MRITLRLIVSLIVVVVSVALISAWLNVRSERMRLYEEVRSHSALLAESFKEACVTTSKPAATPDCRNWRTNSRTRSSWKAWRFTTGRQPDLRIFLSRA